MKKKITKNVLLALTMVIALLCFAGVSSAFDPEKDALFTCDSNPEDFNGKTFNKLYVLLSGCENFDSPIIPGKEVFKHCAILQ